jgi:NADH-quinone oxidoreductase subunit C
MNPEQPAKPPADKTSEPTGTPSATPVAPPKPAVPAAAAKPPVPPKPVVPPPKPWAVAFTPWESELTAHLSERFGGSVSEFGTYVGQNVFVAELVKVPDVIEYLKCEEGFDYLVDITAVDWLNREERFDVVYVLYSFRRNERIRVKTRIKLGQKPQTVMGVHLTANWLEREIFDMFGIEFQGHPDLRRILMPDEWEGHPLRKDYNILQMDNRWVQENLGIESGQ